MSGARDAALAWQAAVERRYRAARPRSEALHLRARSLLPGGDTRFGATVEPFGTVFTEGHGEELTDVDGNVVLDTTHNATALIHGHAHPAIVDAVTRQIANGTQWLGLNPALVDLADLIVSRVPSVERVRFTNSGTEADALMVKVARAFTGRDRFLKMDNAYHGSGDLFEFGPSGPSNATAPSPLMAGLARNLADNVVIGHFNDAAATVDLIRRERDTLAGVIVTPVMSTGMIEPMPGFLEALRAETEAHGILLLFDEVITLRLARGGAQERYGVTPDMTAMGKIIGGGFPVGAYGGRADIMAITDPSASPQVFHAGTYNGNPVSATAGRASLELLTPDAFERLEDAGRGLEVAIGDAIERSHAPFRLNRAGSLLYLEFVPDGEAGTGASPDVSLVAPLVRRRLPAAWLSHGLLGSAINATTVITDEQIAEVGRHFEAAMNELMEYVGDWIAPDRLAAVG